MRAVLILLLVCLPRFAFAATFHIAPNGNDTSNGEANAPFRTLSRALQAARDARAHGSDDVRVVLHTGRYELTEPIRITEADSGSKGHPLVIEAAKGERPVLSGGHQITGWKRDAANPNLWHAAVPKIQHRNGEAQPWYFRELFVNGQRKTRARTPNNGFFRIDGQSPQDKPLKLHFKSGDIKKEWAESGDVEVVALFAWSDIRMQIRAVDDKNNIATLSGNPRPSNRENNARYWVENAPEFLDAPGEWHLDRKSGIVSYLSQPDEDLSKAEVIAPELNSLIAIEGNKEQRKPVHDITFRGIAFEHTGWTLPDDGYADTQAAVAVHGDLRASFAEDIQIENSVFAHLANYAIDLGPGCKRFQIIRNDIVDIGAGGIRIGEPGHPKTPFEENNSHAVTDNHLHELGRIYPPAVGIFILQSGTNLVAHNDIHDLYYTAISVGWNWGYQETPCRENIIEFNHLHDIGQNMLSDMGAIYTLGIQHGTVIRNNLIHDVSSLTYGGWGLYTDEGSTGILLENNIVYNCKSAGFHQHYGKENVLRNNIIAYNRENQLMRTREEAHTSFTFTNNIVYFGSGNLLGSNWSNDHYVMDNNVYFDTRLAGHPEKMKFAGATFDEWKKRGHDLHSKITDPQFIAPEKRDFNLRSGSPALALGFKPIDISTVGPRREGK
jgi:parallel beta-helix repeat protein